MVLPLLRPHPRVALALRDTLFVHELSAQTLQLRDFGVRWEERYAR
jgi:hypothetical protein